MGIPENYQKLTKEFTQNVDAKKSAKNCQASLSSWGPWGLKGISKALWPRYLSKRPKRPETFLSDTKGSLISESFSFLLKSPK